jgi:hypothetical protein
MIKYYEETREYRQWVDPTSIGVIAGVACRMFLKSFYIKILVYLEPTMSCATFK